MLAVALWPIFAPALFSQTTFNFGVDDGGFTAASSGTVQAPWIYSPTAGVGGSGAWYVNGADNGGGLSNSSLISPLLSVVSSGTATISFIHRYNFEDASTPWDGGQLQVSVNGGAFTPVLGSAFTANGYTNTLIGHGVLEGLSGFTGTSPGYATPSNLTSTATLGSFLGGDTLRIKFLGAWDEFTVASAPNWAVDEISFTNVVPEPQTYGLFSGLAVLGWAAHRRRVANAKRRSS